MAASEYAYVTLDGWKAYATPGSSSTALDAKWTADLLSFSRLLERSTHRRFFPVFRARLFHHVQAYSAYALPLNHDLLSVVSVKTNNGSVTIPSGAYVFEPEEPPYYLLNVLADSGYALLWTGSTFNAHVITGHWGLHDDYALSAWPDSARVLTANALAGDTAISVGASADAVFHVGQMLRINDEYLLVSAVGADTLTVVRGFSGTTAAAHTSGDRIYIYAPPRVVENAIYTLMKWDQDGRPGAKSITLMSGAVIDSTGGWPEEVVSVVKMLDRRRAA